MTFAAGSSYADTVLTAVLAAQPACQRHYPGRADHGQRTRTDLRVTDLRFGSLVMMIPRTTQRTATRTAGSDRLVGF